MSLELQEAWKTFTNMYLSILERIEQDIKELEAKEANDFNMLKADIADLRATLVQEIHDLKAQSEIDTLKTQLQQAVKDRLEAEKEKDLAFQGGVQQGQLVEKVDSSHHMQGLLRGGIIGLGFTIVTMIITGIIKAITNALGWGFFF